MFRILSLALAIASTPALAAAPYHARPAAKPAAEKLVLRDTIWKCGEGGCFAGTTSSSRPAIVCAVLARELGRLDSFSVAGRPLTPDELEKCNARAD